MNRGAILGGCAAAALVLPFAMVLAQRPPQSELRAPSSFEDIPDRRMRSIALFTEMGKVLQHPRCVNCHPRSDRPLQGDTGVAHNPPVARGPDGHGVAGLECDTCHGPANVSFTGSAGSIPGHPNWHLAPREMAWEGKSLAEICVQLKDRRRNGGKSPAEIHKHNAEDGLVGWGWNPGEGRSPAPGTQRLFGELTRAWIDAGAACPE